MVTFDAVGPSSSGAGGSTSPLSWTHPGGSSPTLALVFVSVDTANDAGFNTTVTYGGVSMTSVKRWESGGSSQVDGYLQLFKLLSPPSGSQTVSVSVGGTPISGVTGGSLTFNQAGDVGTPVTADSNAANASSGSLAVSTTSTSSLAVCGVADGSGFTAWTAGTNRYICNFDTVDGAGNSAAATLSGTGGSVTFSWTQSSDWYAAIAVEVKTSAAPMPGATAASSLVRRAPVPRFRYPRPAPSPSFGGIIEGPSSALNVNYDFESGISPWVAYPFGSVAQSSAWSSHGNFSIQFTPDGVNHSGVWSESGIPCSPGQEITFSLVAWSAQGWTGSTNGIQAQIWWNTGVAVSGANVPLPASTNTPVSFTAEVPPGVVSFQLEISISNVPPATTLFNFDMASATVLEPIDIFVPNASRFSPRYSLLAAAQSSRRRQTADYALRSAATLPPGTDTPRYPQRSIVVVSIRHRITYPAPQLPVISTPFRWDAPRYAERIVAPWLRYRPKTVPSGLPVLVQAPERMQAVHRWSRPLWPRKGLVPPSSLPLVIPPAPLNPIAMRRVQRYQWFRRGNVAPTGWPVPVQPPMSSQWLRRWSKPLLPRRGVVPTDSLPTFPPAAESYRARFKPLYPRKGNPQPQWGLPVPVQPKELPHSVRARFKPPYPRRGIAWPESGDFPVPIQPPKTSAWYRRRSKPLFPRRGQVENFIRPGATVVTGYQQLTLQTFTYVPGGAGVDLTRTNLALFPLDRLGVTFPNWYGNVVLFVFNDTAFGISVTPNVIRTVEKQLVQLPTYTLTSGSAQWFGPYPINDFTDRFGNMSVNISTQRSGVYTGAFLLQWAPPIGHTGPYDLLGARLKRLIQQHEAELSSTPGEIHPGEGTPGG